MVSFTRMLEKCKVQGSAMLGEGNIERIAREVGHDWREGKLPPGKTVQSMLEQIAAGNVSCAAVRHLCGGTFTGEAYCQARARLPLEVLQRLNQEVSQAVMKNASSRADNLPEVKRIFILDGSGFAMPDSEELREHFGLRANQKPGCGYPTCHLLLQTGPAGAATAAVCSPYRSGDMTHIQQVQPTLRGGDLVLGDRLFSNWGHFCLLNRCGACGLFKAHPSRKIEFGKHKNHGPNRRFVKKLGYRDQLVEYRKPQQRPEWMSAPEFERAPQWMVVREIRRTVKMNRRRRQVTLVTTLLDEQKYPPEKLIVVLDQRWTIETDLRSLKTIMGLERVRCRTVVGVHKELLAYLLVYNLVRLVMLQAAQRQGVALRRISFADALAWVRHHPAWAGLYDLLVNPLRKGRIEPRVVKRRNKPFPFMTRPREKLRQAIFNKQLAA